MPADTPQSSVTHGHTQKPPIPPARKTPAPRQAAPNKKAELNAALEDFTEQARTSSVNKPSLLTDEDDVLHVGNESRGTIIRDTKDDWRFTSAVKDSLSSWYKDKERKLKKKLARPTPKRENASAASRSETVKKAAEKSALARTERFTPKAPVRIHKERGLTSGIRIKRTDVPGAVGETNPRWTHIVPEAEPSATPRPTSLPRHETISDAETSTPTAPPKPERDPLHLLEDPEDELMLPAPRVQRETVTKKFRTVKTAPPTVLHATNVSPSITAAAKTTPPGKAVPQNEQARTGAVTTTERDLRSTAHKTEPEGAPSHDSSKATAVPRSHSAPAAQQPTDAPDKERAAPRTEERAIPITTVILVIVFIVVVAFGSSIANLLQNESSVTSTPAPQTGLLSDSVLVPVTLTPNATELTAIESAASANGQRVEFVSADSDEDATPLISSWGGFFATDILRGSIGSDGGELFLVARTSSRDAALAGMLSEERDPHPALRTLFGWSTEHTFTESPEDEGTLRTGTGVGQVPIAYLIRPDGYLIIAPDAQLVRTLSTSIK